jgi:hypothetical protein
MLKRENNNQKLKSTKPKSILKKPFYDVDLYKTKKVSFFFYPEINYYKKKSTKRSTKSSNENNEKRNGFCFSICNIF